MYPTSRLVDDDAKATEITSTEHQMQYVWEMTKAKVQALKQEGGALPEAPVEEVRYGDEDEEGAVVDEDVPEAPAEEDDFV
jgi:intron-binding protein aquarius